MKKLLFGTVAAIGLSLAIAGGASADPQKPNANQICADTGNLGGLFDDQGGCISTVNQYINNNETLGLCKILRELDVLFVVPANNLGQCVKNLGGPK